MRTLVGLIGLVLAAHAAAAIPPRATSGVTGLLRAETLADKARRQLQVPARSGPGWRKGGGGWSRGGGGRDAPSPHEAPATPIRIEVRPARSR